MRTGIVSIDVALAPSLVQAEWRGLVCIVVDVLRASSTIVTLFERGCDSVYTASSVSGAWSLAREKGLLIGGERDGLPLEGFDFGNSPSELQGIDLDGKSVVLTTTNGTKAVRKAASSEAVLIGCFLNASACCKKALEIAEERGAGVGIVCAGEKGKFVLDDAFCAGYLVKKLKLTAEAMGIEALLSDSARAAERLYGSYPDIRSCFLDSASGRRLLEIRMEEDIAACSRVDASEAVPVLVSGDPCEFKTIAKHG